MKTKYNFNLEALEERQLLVATTEGFSEVQIDFSSLLADSFEVVVEGHKQIKSLYQAMDENYGILLAIGLNILGEFFACYLEQHNDEALSGFPTNNTPISFSIFRIILNTAMQMLASSMWVCYSHDALSDFEKRSKLLSTEKILPLKYAMISNSLFFLSKRPGIALATNSLIMLLPGILNAQNEIRNSTNQMWNPK